MDDLELYKSFAIKREQQHLYKSSELLSSWAVAYPFLFDAQDVEIARNQAKYGYHYFEWLAAILLYHTEGLYSLVEQYQYQAHKLKQTKLKKLMPKGVIDFMASHPEFGKVQCPDLLVYKQDFTDWFFVEVKGPKDDTSPQQSSFYKELSRVSQKPVRKVEFKYI